MPEQSGSACASFHLVRFAGRHVPAALVRAGLDRVALARTPGLAFWRLLGTGRGRDTGRSADLRRWALFAVWEHEAALDAFLDTNPVVGRWRRHGTELWQTRLAVISAHGSWRGGDPLAALAPVTDDGGPVLALTRADVRVARWSSFRRAGPAVSAGLVGVDGLRAVAGIGEAPILRQATVSVWTSSAHLTRWAYGQAAHTDAIRRTRTEGWFGEELFARFRPYASAGTWDGVDPVG